MPDVVSMAAQFAFGWLRHFKFWAVLDEYERGVVLRLGRHTRTLGPGLHWIVPLVDVLWVDNVVPAAAELTVSAVTVDGVSVLLTACVRWSIENIERVVLRVEGREALAMQAVRAAVCSIVARTPWVAMRAPGTVRRITRRARSRAAADGVRIESVTWGDLARARSVRVLGWAQGGHTSAD